MQVGPRSDEGYSREEVEEKISRALAQADRGEAISGEEAFRRLRAHADAHVSKLAANPRSPGHQDG